MKVSEDVKILFPEVKQMFHCTVCKKSFRTYRQIRRHRCLEGEVDEKERVIAIKRK